MMNKTILLTFTLLVSSVALAKIDCHHEKSNLVKEEFFIKNPSMVDKVDCPLLGRIHEQIDAVSDSFKHSPEVILFLKARSFDAFFDQGYIINVSQKFFRKNKKGENHVKGGEEILPIVSHEYGHAIFSDLLHKNFPLLRPVFNRMKEISLKKSAIESIKQKMAKTDLTIKERVKLRDSMYALAKEHKEMKGKFLNRTLVKKVKKVTDPYHELFADIVAVYYYDNKDVIKRALDHPNYSKEEKKVLLRRSFHQHVHDIDPKDIHGLFGKVRSHIGNHYIPMTEGDKKLYLDIIFKAMEKEIRRSLLPSFSEKTPLEMNDKLIERIDEEFSKHLK